MVNNKAKNKQYDLEERTLEFGKKIVRFCKKVPKNTVTMPLIDQCIRAGTSTGANYIEANEGLSRKDFVHRIRISRKEAKETRYWLFLIVEAWPQGKREAEKLASEAKEYVLIFSQILKNTTGKSRFS